MSDVPPHQPANRLAQESSPYLLQHAHNPVDWYPWGEAAFAKAQAENKPILLSVGYSACHWCHVMAHESFEDQETAELMNHWFVNIKLDREERPDIDKIYQTAQSLLTQRTGGWPLTMFLEPEGHCPFFGGTYFPKEARHNLPPFKQVLQRVRAYYDEHREDILKQNEMLKDTLRNIYAPVTEIATPSPTLNEAARQALIGQFDAVHGGFGDEPKFPHSELMQFMLHCDARAKAHGKPDSQAQYAALYTLQQMCRGGLYDHLGGGFYRYSVDAAWQIPHFEKMLYDNGPLLGVLAAATHVSDNPRFATTALETARWVRREMQSPEGGYYATLDADSEGGEGAFYIWDKSELDAVLPADDAALTTRHFGLDKVPNFEGRWHLHVAEETDTLANTLGKDRAAVHAAIERSRRALLTHRERRPRPARDDKILTSWNALMIKGMAQAAQQLGDADCYHSALSALEFIHSTLWRDGRLAASYKDGRVQLSGYLDDYAFLLDAIFFMLQYRWCGTQLTFALELADAILERFEDTDHGGYYFTAHDHERLIQRPRILHDEATPSGYGIAALTLARFGLLCGENRYLASAERALAQATPTLTQTPHACTTLLYALAEQHEPPEIIVIRAHDKLPSSPRDDTDSGRLDNSLRRWWQTAAAHPSPLRFCFAIPADATSLPAALHDKPLRGEACAYLCRGTTCRAPIERLDEFKSALTPDTATQAA